MVKFCFINNGLSLKYDNSVVPISNLIEPKNMTTKVIRNKMEKLYTLPDNMFNAVDFTSTDLINESTSSVPTFIKGEKYSLKGTSCDGFEMKEKVYELIGTIENYGNVPIESVIVKQVSGNSEVIFTLSKNDCDKIGIEYQQGLQLFPKSLPWNRVINSVEFDPHNLATTPSSVVDNTIRFVLLKLDGFKDYSDGYVITPSGNLIKEEQFENSVRVVTKEPIVYGNGFHFNDNAPLKIKIVKPNTSLFNHGNFISSDNEVFILIELRMKSYSGQPTFDGYFGVIPKYLGNINPNDFFVIKWDEFGAKTIKEYEAEKERIIKEREEAIRREEERLRKEEERRKRETEQAINRMKMLEIKRPIFPDTPSFKTDMEALAGLDLYIDSLDMYFKDINKELSRLDYSLCNFSRNFKIF